MINWFSHMFPYTNVHELNLDWIIDNFKEFITEVDSLEAWKTQHEQEYEQLLGLYNEVKDELDNLNSGNFPESFYNALKEWFELNAIDLVGEMVKFVFFGLTQDGYFVAYIPDTWDSIEFNTIVAPGENYGRLVIEY